MMRDSIAESATRFARDIGPHERNELLPYGHIGPERRIPLRPHELTVLHDDGLYRHLRFRSPDTSVYWFDLITVPGALIFRGDGDSFVFARAEDMLTFFRGSAEGSINPVYWSEKLTCGGGRRGAMSYSRELFEYTVRQYVAECIRDGGAPRGIGRAVTVMLRDADLTFEEDARQALESFEFGGFEFQDTWEWSFRDFDWWFLWACHAIVWGIARYDQARSASAVAA